VQRGEIERALRRRGGGVRLGAERNGEVEQQEKSGEEIGAGHGRWKRRRVVEVGWVGGGAAAGRSAAGKDGGEAGSMWGHGVLDKLRGHATSLSRWGDRLLTGLIFIISKNENIHYIVLLLVENIIIRIINLFHF
jgi:hypothetical protein